MSKKRLPPGERREAILNAALDVAEINGYMSITRQAVADQAGVTLGLITHYFSTMNQLKRAVMRAAIAQERLVVIAQGLAIGDDHAIKAPLELRHKASSYIVNR